MIWPGFLDKSIILTDGQTQLRVTDEPVKRRCVVVASSGSYEADQHACGRALAAIPSNAAGIPEGTYLFPGRDRRYTNGTCAYPTGVRPTTAEEAVCKQLLNSMGKARVTMAIEPERWVRPADLKDLSRNPGQIMVSIGVSAAGRASYCAVIRSSENASLDALVCQAILTRAKFAPALDKDGQPIPSAYDRQWIL
jgi:TonB family protein